MTLTISRLSFIVALVTIVGFGGRTPSGSSSGSQDVAALQPSTPLTAAAVALLANNFEPRAAETTRLAIASTDPSVRAVGARLAGAMSAVALTGAIWSALEREQDPVVAAEMVRALLFLRGAAAVELVESRLDRSSRIPLVYAEWLAWMQPAKLADVLPTLAARLGDDRSELNPLVERALDRRPDVSEALLRAWLGATSADAWRMFLRELPTDSPRPGLDTVLIEALNSKDVDIRVVTVWNVITRLAQGRSVSSAVLDAAVSLDHTVPAADAASPTWEQFGREVIARRHANRKTPDRAALITAQASRNTTDSRALAVLDQITGPERKALQAALGDRFPKKPSEIRDSTPVVKRGEAMRTMPTIWPGLLKSLVETAGCKPGADASLPGVVSVAYRGDGRVGQIAVNEGLPPECDQVITALARLTIADAVYPSPMNAPEWLVLPLDQDYLDCTSRTSSTGQVRPGKLNPGASIEPPRKVRDVRPVYPSQLQKRKVEGTVVMEGIVEPSGCIAVIRVVRGVDAALDFAAVRAVSGWQFTPTKVDGRDVPSVMTVSINYSLR